MVELSHNEDSFEELFDSATYRGYLHTMSHFHSYSWRNVLMIFRQMPHATKLAEFGRWKQQGRKIIKNSKTIKILAPIPQEPVRKLVEKIDTETGEVALDEHGKRVMDEQIIELPPKFEEKRLLDVSQTEGEPMPRLAGDVLSDASLCAAFFEAIKMLYPSASDGAEPRALPDIIQRISHENEFIAKSTAYVVLTRFGIDGADAPLSEKIDAREFAETLDVIRTTAHEIISNLEEKLTEICHKRGINPMTLPKSAEAAPEVMLEKSKETTSSQIETKLEDFAPSEKISDAPQEKALQGPPPMEESQVETPVVTEQLGEKPPAIRQSIPPDPEITIAQRNLYGYIRPELLPLRKNRAHSLFLRGLPIYMLHENNTESMVFYETDIEKHNSIFGIPDAHWQNSRECIALASGNPDAIKEARFIYDSSDAYAIFQLNDKDISTISHRFKTYEALMINKLPINRSNYGGLCVFSLTWF